MLGTKLLKILKLYKKILKGNKKVILKRYFQQNLTNLN